MSLINETKKAMGHREGSNTCSICGHYSPQYSTCSYSSLCAFETAEGDTCKFYLSDDDMAPKEVCFNLNGRTVGTFSTLDFTNPAFSKAIIPVFGLDSSDDIDHFEVTNTGISAVFKG